MSRRLTLGTLLLAAACSRSESPAGASRDDLARSAAAPAAPMPRAAAASDAAPASQLDPIPNARFAAWFEELSEPDHDFFSDNLVSNETSYLQVSRLLRRSARKRGAYIGVGPEQNFSYIAMIEPALAFIVDIRRQNALLHLLYKVAFERATSRAHFLALMLGREWKSVPDPGNAASIEAVLEAVERLPPSAGWRDVVRQRLVDGLGLRLTQHDLDSIARAEQAFAKHGLGVRFELRGGSRTYPTLRELLLANDEMGNKTSFLADERSFRFVQKLERENRILPVVGDFAGEHAFRGIASKLKERDLPVSVFYVSNVEQYLLEPEKWQHYVVNVEALPTNEQSLFVRAYLEQGRRHPLQQPGHRTATLVGSFDQFRWSERKRGRRSYWQIVNEDLLADTHSTPAASR